MPRPFGNFRSKCFAVMQKKVCTLHLDVFFLMNFVFPFQVRKKIWNIYHCHPKSRVKDRFTTPAAYKLDQVNFLLFFRAEWWMSFRFLATLFFKCTHAPPASLFDLIALFCLFCGEFPLCLLALKAILLCQNTPLAWQGSSFQLISCFVGFDF